MGEPALTNDNKIVAISFLTREEVRVIGSSLKHVYPLPDDGKFDELLRSLDLEGEPAGSTQSPV